MNEFEYLSNKKIRSFMEKTDRLYSQYSFDFLVRVLYKRRTDVQDFKAENTIIY